MPQAASRPPVSIKPPPKMPVGLPVRAGAAGQVRQAAMSTPTRPLPAPNNKVNMDYLSMPPPRLPVSSISSTNSSQPSLSSDSSMDSPPLDSSFRAPHERIKTPLQETNGDNLKRNGDVDAQFDSLLDSLEVPSSVRIKFGNVTPEVKQSILKSTMSSNPSMLAALGLPARSLQTPQKPKLKNRLSTPRLRQSKSAASSDVEDEYRSRSGSLASVGKTLNVGKDQFVIVASPKKSKAMSHRSGQSVDIPRTQRLSTPTRPSSMFVAPPSPSSHSKGANAMFETPANYVRWLGAYKGTDLSMDVGRAKKLRMLLRHETTGWVSGFVDAGGYSLILDRLQDLLNIEWREEQHDDQMLYELLRCIKALGTSEAGKAALRDAHPRPFPELSKLLFSEKKPGDLPCRQVIIELWLFHFELFPSCNTPKPSTVRFGSLPAESFDVSMFVRSLFLPEQEDKTKEYHDFVQVAHRPRIFKSWVQELSDICRDYFWVMCHGSNTLWELNEVNEKVVERPVAPGGATGGVEFEAMGYVTTHFRLLNTLSLHLAQENPQEAAKMHQDLLMSGLDRILVTMRKASTTYYPTLHLEIARYVDLLRRSSPNQQLPYLIRKLVGPPPEEMRRHKSASEWLPRTAWA